MSAASHSDQADLTVLITTHDRPEYLRTALTSVRQQTCHNRIREVLVSDNGPERLAARVAREFPEIPIRYVEAPADTDFCAHGLLAFAQVKTPLLAMLQDDDWWHPGHLAASFACLDANPEVAYAASANLWVRSEVSTAPPLYFNFELLHNLSGSGGIEPVRLDWKQVLMLCWTLTPFHLSAVVGRMAAFRTGLDAWKERNYLVDRLHFALVAQHTKQDVIFLPYPSVLIRVHEQRVTSDLAGAFQIESGARAREIIRGLAETESINLNQLWRAAMPALGEAALNQLSALAKDCLLPEDVLAMGCPEPTGDSPWLPPAANAETRKLRQRIESAKQVMSPERGIQASAALAVALVEKTGKSLLGRWFVPKAGMRNLRQAFVQARKAWKKDESAIATEQCLNVAGKALGMLEKFRDHAVLRRLVSREEVESLKNLIKSQSDIWKKCQPPKQDAGESDMPGTFGIDTAYYSSQAGRSFADSKEAARHYHREGWRAGLQPNAAFDTAFFWERNRDSISKEKNPLREYRRLLEGGGAPEVHPAFPGVWSRQYFWETSNRDLQPTSKSPGGEPDQLAEARAFSALTPRLCAGIILYHTSEEELLGVLRSLRLAVNRAETEGCQRPLVALTDNSQLWTAERIAEVAARAGIEAHFFATQENVGFGRGHNHLMERVFKKLGATHYFCLNPDGCLHPDAMVELIKAIRRSELPALIEALQFPCEHPKDYDPVTLETNWCSAGSLVIPRFLFDLTGGFDPRFFMYCEDVDLGWRVWEKGYKCLVAPKALFHHRVASRASNPRALRWTLESGRLIARKWGNARFQLLCERRLVENGLSVRLDEMPPLPPIEKHDPHGRVDFSHHFTFSLPRW